MDETEDECAAAVVAQRLDAAGVGDEVAVKLAGFNVEDVDEDFDVLEDVVALLGEVVLHECVLSVSALRWVLWVGGGVVGVCEGGQWRGSIQGAGSRYAASTGNANNKKGRNR